MSSGLEMISGAMPGKEILVGVGTGVGVIRAAFKSFKKVPPGEMGLRTRWDVPRQKNGKYRVVNPGPRIMLPFSDSIKTISVLDRSNDLEDITVDRACGQIVVKSSVTWGVIPDPEGESLYRALYVAENLKEGVTNICWNGLNTVLNGISDEEFKRKGSIYGNLQDECRDKLDGYGVDLRRLDLGTNALTPAQVIRGRPGDPPPSITEAAVATLTLVPGLPDSS